MEDSRNEGVDSRGAEAHTIHDALVPCNQDMMCDSAGSEPVDLLGGEGREEVVSVVLSGAVGVVAGPLHLARAVA